MRPTALRSLAATSVAIALSTLLFACATSGTPRPKPTAVAVEVSGNRAASPLDVVADRDAGAPVSTPMDARFFYRRAQAALDAGRLDEARAGFAETVEKFGHSRVGGVARLRVADIDFARGDYVPAAEGYNAWANERVGYYGDPDYAEELRTAIFLARRRAVIALCRAKRDGSPCLEDEHGDRIPERRDPTTFVEKPDPHAGDPNRPVYKVP